MIRDLSSATVSPEGPGVTTSWSEKARFVRKCHHLLVTRGTVCAEEYKEFGKVAVGDLSHGGEAHGSE